MSFAVLEKTLADLSIDKVARAFERMPNLTKQDAAVRAKDAAGVLATHLSQSEAALLCRVLGAEGVAALAVDQASLPLLPKAKALRRAIPRNDALLYYDPLGREQRIPWSSITLLAAGNVNEVDFKRARLDHDLMHDSRVNVALSDLDAKQSVKLNLMLEMLLSCEPHRCYVEGNTFTYEYLGALRSNRSADNFVLFARDVMRRATRAVRNRGAELLRADPPKALTYASRHAFEQEIIWQLWARKMAAGIV
jgi:hypothetical protein